MFSSQNSQVAAVATQAEAIDFDGTNDYLSRSTDLVGNADGKTFTFSAWVYVKANTSYFIYDATSGTQYDGFRIYIGSGTGGPSFTIDGRDASNTLNLRASIANAAFPVDTWVHIVASVNLASTSNRSIYINDIAQTVSWSTYTNTAINFTSTNHYIGTEGETLSSDLQGRLSNIYLDYTYRDLSIEANRRLFVTADLKPADGQAALSPILYLPMSDPTTVGTNAGTGGNFTLTGTIARSGRGPNQYNAQYSDLDGTADYLSRTTALTGLSDGKAFTFHFVANIDHTSANQYVFRVLNSTTERLNILFQYISGTSYRVRIQGYNASGTGILNAVGVTGEILPGRNYVVTGSIDLNNSSNRSVYINGSVVAMTWATYTNDTIDLAPTTPVFNVGRDGGTVYFNGRLGALWFNTSYIDLSVASNLAKFVSGTGIDAKPVDLGATGELPTGTSPLIYLPMYGNNAGKNYGTGGDFTVNSGPYTGARGPNEFWGNKADFDGTTGYLAKDTGITGLAASKTFSMSFWCSPDVSGTNMRVVSGNAGGVDNRLNILRQTTNDLAIVARNSSGTTILEGYTTAVFTAGASLFVQISIDMAATSKRFVYINGVANSVSWTTYTNDTIDFTTTYWTVGASYFSGSRNLFFDGKLSEFYLTTDYIDFSQETNRLKFRDAFGNPVDLTQQIEDAAIPNPAIYMRFDPANQGLNSGTGGNFTKTGTITDGGQL